MPAMKLDSEGRVVVVGTLDAVLSSSGISIGAVEIDGATGTGKAEILPDASGTNAMLVQQAGVTDGTALKFYLTQAADVNATLVSTGVAATLTSTGVAATLTSTGVAATLTSTLVAIGGVVSATADVTISGTVATTGYVTIVDGGIVGATVSGPVTATLASTLVAIGGVVTATADVTISGTVATTGYATVSGAVNATLVSTGVAATLVSTGVAATLVSTAVSIPDIERDENNKIVAGVADEIFQASITSASVTGTGNVIKAATASKFMILRHIVGNCGATAVTLSIQDAGSAVLVPSMFLAANGGFVIDLPSDAPIVVGTNLAISLFGDVAGNCSALITGYLTSTY